MKYFSGRVAMLDTVKHHNYFVFILVVKLMPIRLEPTRGRNFYQQLYTMHPLKSARSKISAAL